MPTKSVDVEILKTEKLNGHNYDDWHKDLKIPLEGVLYIEDTISERPFTPAWQQYNTIARNIILSSLHNELKPIYKVHDVAKELWDVLACNYALKSDVMTRRMEREFHHYKMPKLHQ